MRLPPRLTTYRATADCMRQNVLPVLPGRGSLADTGNITLSPWARWNPPVAGAASVPAGPSPLGCSLPRHGADG